MPRAHKQTTQLELLANSPARVTTPLSRATALRGRTHEAPAPKPWQCVVLAIDTARISGWSVYCAGKLRGFGEVDTLKDEALDDVLLHLVAVAAAARMPSVLVLEAPYGGSVDVVTALGAARERWLRVWRQSGQAATHVVKVKPSTWRAAVLGRVWNGRQRDDIREQERRTAEALTGIGPMGHDAAAAVLIGRWASHARAVGRVIGKRALRASLRAWTGAP